MKNNLPSNWSWVKLGDIIDKIPTTGKKLKQKEYLTEGKYPVIDQGQELIGGYTNEQNLLIDCDPPVIIFGDHTKIKKFVNFKFVPGADGVKVIKPSEKYDAKLFYYFLHCIKIPDKGYARHFQFVEKAVIPLPPLPEQKKIVAKIEELFSELDNGIKQLNKAKQQLKIYRQAVLNWAFSGRLVRVARGKKKEILKAAEPEVHYNGNGLPEGWKWVKLGEIKKEVKMVQKKSVNPEEEFIYYDIGGVNNNTNTIESYKNYKWKEAPSRARQIVIKGDVLFSTVRTYLKNIALLNNDYDNQIASTGFCVIRPNESELLSNYVFHYTLYKNFLEPLNALQTGSSYPAVRDNDVFNQIIPLPPINEQTQIVEEIESRFSVADKMEQAMDESLKKSETLRQSILKKAFEGRLV